MYNFLKKVVFLIVFVLTSYNSFASFILIPMDEEKQSNHLKLME